MIRKDTDHAFRMLASLCAKPDDLVNAGELSERLDVPASFAKKILRRLAQAGILRPRPGRNGGFGLAREAAEISMLDVIEAVQGRPALNICMESPKRCPHQPECLFSRHFRGLQDRMEDFLRKTSLANVLGLPRRKARRPASRNKNTR